MTTKLKKHKVVVLTVLGLFVVAVGLIYWAYLLTPRLETASATAWDISTAIFIDSFSVISQDSGPRGPAFGAGGLKMFVVGTSGQDINEYTLTAGFDVSTASFVDSFSVSSQETSPRGVVFNVDGTKMFVVGIDSDAVYEYTLTAGFDVSTASYADGFGVGSQDTLPVDLVFSADGTEMFVLGYTGRDVNEYTLTAGFDVSTASFVDSFSVSSQVTDPAGLAFKSDGTKMFVADSGGDDINEYSLSVAWDISTASYAGNFSISSEDADAMGLTFSEDGTKMFVAGGAGDDVNEYLLPGDSTYAFTNASASGRLGPNQGQVDSAYLGTSLDGLVTVTGSGIQEWDVQTSGVHTIEVWGAEGGDDTSYGGSTGKGARMRGEFNLTAGTTLKILVGQQGTSQTYDGAGGGGTFVTDSSNTPYIAAGGGGGASGGTSGMDGVTSTSGTTANPSGGAGGTNGSGGTAGSNAGSGGGLTGNGQGGSNPTHLGYSFTNGGAGGDGAVYVDFDGGFGGGATSHGGGWGGGGAGGYSGGGAHTAGYGGGGGGSYNNGTSQSNSAGVREDHGLVVITAPSSRRIIIISWLDSLVSTALASFK